MKVEGTDGGLLSEMCLSLHNIECLSIEGYTLLCGI
jgi:hypothetical protein